MPLQGGLGSSKVARNWEMFGHMVCYKQELVLSTQSTRENLDSSLIQYIFLFCAM